MNLKYIKEIDYKLDFYTDYKYFLHYILLDFNLEKEEREYIKKIVLKLIESKTFLDIANQINSILERKVKIVYLPRKIKISHRKFNINKLKKDFKLIRLKSINEGLIDLLKSR